LPSLISLALFLRTKKPPDQRSADTDGPVFPTIKYSASDPIFQVSQNKQITAIKLTLFYTRQRSTVKMSGNYII
jgi:hypothetical protein